MHISTVGLFRLVNIFLLYKIDLYKVHHGGLSLGAKDDNSNKKIKIMGSRQPLHIWTCRVRHLVDLSVLYKIVLYVGPRAILSLGAKGDVKFNII